MRAEIDGLRARQRAVEDLQADRNLPVYLIDEVASRRPKAFICAASSRKIEGSMSAAGRVQRARIGVPAQSAEQFARTRTPELIEIKVAAAVRRASIAAFSSSR